MTVGLPLPKRSMVRSGDCSGSSVGVPETDDDAIVGKVGADALADGPGLGESKRGQRGDEDDSVGLVGERVEDFAGDRSVGRMKGLVVGVLHDLDEHVGGELVGLIAGGDADDGEVAAAGARRQGWRGVGVFFGLIVGEFGD